MTISGSIPLFIAHKAAPIPPATLAGTSDTAMIDLRLSGIMFVVWEV
jgi:hypothetical protein